MRLLVRLALAAVAALALLVAAILFVSEGVTGERHPRGTPASEPRPEAEQAARAASQRAAREAVGAPAEAPQILFGDLHVHTTYSADAFVFSLPLFQGEGVHPPADACDFARFCAELDFWSINDHAENLTPWQWAETKRAVRECNAVAGDPASPDLVSFLGWEWTQSSPPGVGGAGRPHYGHKNVVLLDTAEERVPARPIGAGAGGVFAQANVPAPVWALVRAAMTVGDLGHLQPYLDFNRYTREVRATPPCAEGVPERALPEDCQESAETPEELFAKLDEWGTPSLVVPHGTTWGIHAPPGADLALQLAPGQNDPARQRLFEVYSGHGNSELYRDVRDVLVGDGGERSCAPPQDGYLPCCWRAGELIRARCGDAPAEVCEDRVARAREAFLEAGVPRGYGVVPDTAPDDWLECGQLAGTFLPAYDNRPGMSAQYGLAVRRFEDGREVGAFRYGLIGSSDNHKARAGAGYKEMFRKAFGDAYGLRQDWLDRLSADPQPPSPEPLAADAVRLDLARLDPGSERTASYYYTAGLVAVHAGGRDRRSIFDALAARRAYATSGPRILLWFDLEEPDGTTVPMGSEVQRSAEAGPPRFRVRAVGAFEQLPGCPASTRERLDPARITRLCRDECYHPSDRRHAIARIEVVRIRPQTRPDEPVAPLIEDPWRSFPCDGAPEGCSVSFEDPDWDGTREIAYYARALQEPTPAVNGDPMRCERDADGRCAKARLCAASGPTFDPDDDCLAPVQERAWSSPIWLETQQGDAPAVAF